MDGTMIDMPDIFDKIANFGALGAVCAFLLWVAYAKFLPLFGNVVICLDKAISALNEHLEYMRRQNGKK